MNCGQEDLLEIAIGIGVFDPFTGKWSSDGDQVRYTQGPCLGKKDEHNPYVQPVKL